MRRIGLIGGVTWAATADYYRRINLDVHRRCGGHHSADLLVRSLDLHPLLACADRIDEVAGVFETAALDLARGGAQLLAIASFTGHRYAARLRRASLPFVDLPCAVGARLCERAHARIMVWATSYALGDQALLGELAGASGTQLLVPPVEHRSQLDRIIFEELAHERASDAAIAFLQRLLEDGLKAGAEALLLATTDLSPVARLLRSPVPVIDATEIHCTALVDAAFA